MNVLRNTTALALTMCLQYADENGTAVDATCGNGNETLWLAEPGEHPTFYYETALWQYDHHGTVAGIDTEADRNLLFEKTEHVKN